MTVGICRRLLTTDHESFNLAAGVMCCNLSSTNPIGQLDLATCRIALLGFRNLIVQHSRLLQFESKSRIARNLRSCTLSGLLEWLWLRMRLPKYRHDLPLTTTHPLEQSFPQQNSRKRHSFDASFDRCADIRYTASL